MLPGGSPVFYVIYSLYVEMFPGLDLHYADPAQPLTTAGEELGDLSLDDIWSICR